VKKLSRISPALIRENHLWSA